MLGFLLLPSSTGKLVDVALPEPSSTGSLRFLVGAVIPHLRYRALRDLGRLFKTEYILRYIDDPELRETVEGTLTRVEHANHFAKAVNWGGNQAFGWLTYSDQLVAEGCKRLIMNAINYWNLLYLTERLGEQQRSSDRQALLQTVLCSNTYTWHHINLQGEYDFSEGLSRTLRFDVD